MKRTLKWPLRLVLTLMILYAGVCLYMKWAQKSFLFKPIVLAENHSFNLPGNPKEVWMAAEDGARIHALHFKQDSAKGVVLFLHGNGGNVETTAPVYERFFRLNYDVLILDYRGYGKSTGELYQEGLYYDAEAAYDLLKGTYAEDKIVVYGQSMGSGVATKLVAGKNPKGLILETPYTSIRAVAQGNYPWLPIAWLLDFPFESQSYFAQIQCPSLIFHGTADDVIPYAMGQEMAKSNTRAKLVTMQGVDHNGCSKHASYEAELADFLQ